MRFPIVVLLALAAASPGCSSDVTSTCKPSCPPGLVCTAEGCVALDAGTPGGPEDGCDGACTGDSPYCLDGRCVGCITDKDCLPGRACLSVDGVRSCLPGCTRDDQCAALAVDGGSTRLACCAGRCRDLTADAERCGACSNACHFANAGAACVEGSCRMGACTPGWGDCNGDPADGCEQQLRTDARNCTACGKTCQFDHGIAGCADGCYLTGCVRGWGDCDRMAANGCEHDVSHDLDNCGACGHGCAGLAHTTLGCEDNQCRITACDAGWADCDANPDNGCETDLHTNVNHCGACGNSCGRGLVCRFGGCTCPQCNFPGMPSRCINNVCVLCECVRGFACCDLDVRHGCNIDIRNDPMNCGACGNVCPKDRPFCADEVCSKCPRGGWPWNGGCWYPANRAASCRSTCKGLGGSFDAVHAQHAGTPACHQFFPLVMDGANWKSIECCNSGGMNRGADGSPPDPDFADPACELACACTF